jgi:hypothetical protein
MCKSPTVCGGGTGAVPVCLVCFVMPVAFHFATYTPQASLLQWGHRQTPEQAALLLDTEDTLEYDSTGPGGPHLRAEYSRAGYMPSSGWQSEPHPGRGVLQSLKERWKGIGQPGLTRQTGTEAREERAAHAAGTNPTCLGADGWRCGAVLCHKHAEGMGDEFAGRERQDTSGVWAAVCEGVSELVLPAAVALLGLLLGAFSVYDQLIGLT